MGIIHTSDYDDIYFETYYDQLDKTDLPGINYLISSISKVIDDLGADPKKFKLEFAPDCEKQQDLAYLKIGSVKSYSIKNYYKEVKIIVPTVPGINAEHDGAMFLFEFPYVRRFSVKPEQAISEACLYHYCHAIKLSAYSYNVVLDYGNYHFVKKYHDWPSWHEPDEEEKKMHCYVLEKE